MRSGGSKRWVFPVAAIMMTTIDGEEQFVGQSGRVTCFDHGIGQLVLAEEGVADPQVVAGRIGRLGERDSTLVLGQSIVDQRDIHQSYVLQSDSSGAFGEEGFGDRELRTCPRNFDTRSK